MFSGAGLELILLPLSSCIVLETPGEVLPVQAEVLDLAVVCPAALTCGVRVVQGGAPVSFWFVDPLTRPGFVPSLDRDPHRAVLGVQTLTSFLLTLVPTLWAPLRATGGQGTNA